MRIRSSFVVAFVVFASALAIHNDNVQTKIDLSSQILKLNVDITLGGTGEEYVYHIEPKLRGHLSYVEVYFISGTQKEKLDVEPESVIDVEKLVLNLPKSSGVAKLSIHMIFTHVFAPYPMEIAQSEKQYVRFFGNPFYYSQYPTTTQETIIRFPMSVSMSVYREQQPAPPKVLSYTNDDFLMPFKKSESQLTYGPYKNKEAFSQALVVLHYENNSPFLIVTEMTRTIQVSHWGNIAVEEQINVYHDGAKLKGPFSRLDYQQKRDGVSSVHSFNMLLPASSKDVYYRDEIGNISTSNLREMSEAVVVNLRPRFPLFGGWKTSYTIGYNAPAYEYLFNKGSRYSLKMRFLDHIFDNMVVDRFTLKIILPEYTKNIKVDTSFPVQRSENEIVHTYLDMGAGRPVVVLHKDNLVEYHIKNFQVDYELLTFVMIREPLMVIGAFLAMFAIIIIYVRLDFSISKDPVTENKMRTQSYLEEAQNAQHRRFALYQNYEDATSRFKSSKDGTRFSSDKKKIEQSHKALTQELGVLQQRLRSGNRDASDRLNDVQQLDLQYRELTNQAMLSAEKLVTGKLSKNVYIETDTKLRAKKEEILQNMETVMKSL